MSFATVRTKNVNDPSIVVQIDDLVQELLTSGFFQWRSSESSLGVILELLEELHSEGVLDQPHVCANSTQLLVQYRQRHCLNVTKILYERTK